MKPISRVTSMELLPTGRPVATSPTVIRVATVMEMQAVESQYGAKSIPGFIRSVEELTSHGHPASVPEGTGQVQNPEDDEAHDSPDDGASRAAREGVHADGPGEQMRSHDKDLEEDLSPTKDFLEKRAHSDGLSNNLDGITKVFDKGVVFAEVGKHETGQRGEEAHDEDEDDAGNEAEGGDDGGEGQDTERDGFGDEDDTALPVMCVSLENNRKVWRCNTYHQVRVLKSIRAASLDCPATLLLLLVLPLALCLRPVSTSFF